MTVPPKATHRQTRQYNRRLVLCTLSDYGPVSRAEVPRRNGLTYSVLPDSLEALESALLGRLEPSGALPVPLGDLYPVGHGR